jgi:hypothetical protein
MKNPRRGLTEIYSVILSNTTGVNGDDVLEKDWDNLIILDACRYDIFKDINQIPGELDAVRSVGSQTGEFVKKTFGGRELPDTVYVFAKPNPMRVDAQLHDVYNIWTEEWNESIRMVPNDVMVDRALEIAGEYPHKRLIIHFVPPHLPFIGDFGQQLHEEYGHDITEMWDKTRDGEIPVSDMWKAYRENLETTLPEVDRLQEKLTGKTVITSDHGQAFGERGVYSHPPKAYIDVLLRVPWLEIDAQERREIISGSAEKDIMDYELDEAKDQLRDLGYA